MNACVEVHSYIYIRPDQRKSSCGVYSTFGSSTSKYSLKTPKSKSARVFGDKLHA